MNPTLTLADIEYLRQMRANQQNARGGGAAHSRNATGLLSINVVQPKKPVVWPPIPSGIWLIWDAGPNGEADYTDHRYWLRRAYLNNSDGDARTNAPQVKEIAVDSPPSAPQEQFWITAANLAERPAKNGGDDNTDDASKGTHLLAKGTAVDGLRMEIDSGTPIVGRWVFAHATQLARLQIFGNRARGGAYKAYIWNRPSTTAISFDASGAIATTDYGTQGIEVIAINTPEIGYDTHDLTAGTPHIKGFVWGVPSVLSSSTDAKPVFDIVLYDTLDCT